MSTLLLRLAGPLQAWGSSSRFVRRGTESQPTKSGVIGLLAAALGRRRTDPIEDLLALRFGVRLDQPGKLVRDFQTARTLDGSSSMPLSYRYYVADASFLAAIQAERPLLETLDHALRFPTFPLYLGRRSCPPVGPVTLGFREGDVVAALTSEPWHASAWWQRRQRGVEQVDLDLVLDAAPGVVASEVFQDVPLSFDPRRRAYGLRSVVRETVTVANPMYVDRRPALGDDSHDPMAALGGG